MAIEFDYSDDEASDDSDSFSIEDVIKAVQELHNMDDELTLDACDFLENKKNAEIFMALKYKLRRKWLMRKLPRQIRITVRTPEVGGRGIGMEVMTSEKIGEVKSKLRGKTGLSAENQRLFYAGRETVDDRSLADYDVERFTNMVLISKRHNPTK